MSGGFPAAMAMATDTPDRYTKASFGSATGRAGGEGCQYTL